MVARSAGIRPQARTDWQVPGNLWALLVGRPGVMKSPAMAQALAPIERLEARAGEAHASAIAETRRDAAVQKLRADANLNEARKRLRKDPGADVSALLGAADEEEDPPRARYVLTNPTYEKLGEILADNPGGVLSVRDEMRGLFLSLAREESAEARAFYLQAWSGGRYTFDRIGRGTVTVEDARLSLVGAIQPGPLTAIIHEGKRTGADDGLIERLLFCWPDDPGAWRNVDRWPDSDAKRRAWDVFDRLDGITAAELGAEVEAAHDGQPSGQPFLRFESQALDAFTEWRAELEGKLRSSEADGLEAALSKFRHHVPALALMLHVVDGGAGPVTVTPTLRALALAEYFESHARRVHASGRRVSVDAARAILKRAQKGDLSPSFTARDVYRNQWAGLSDRATVEDGLALLAAHGWIDEATVDT
ncbi:MAG: YfjI family protein, partial [Burkholderiaceae bacterium]